MNRAIWANLFWKEWREHRWKLAALTAIYLITYAICLYTTEGEGPFENATIVLIFVTPLAALFIGMGIAAKEQASGTATFLRAQPVTQRYAAIAKLSLGMLTLIVPVLLTLALALLLDSLGLIEKTSDHYPFDHWMLNGPARILVTLILLPAAASGSLLLWFAVLGMKQPSELRAGIVALVAVITVWVVAGATIRLTEPSWIQNDPATEHAWRAHRFVRLTTVPAMPGGILAYASEGTQRPRDQTALMCSALSVYAVTHGLLIWLWVTGYGKNASTAKRRIIEARTSTMPRWLGPPCASPLQAILWKQVRECLPVVGGVIVLALGYATCMTLVEDSAPNSQSKLWAVIWFTAMSGFLAALLVGVAGFQDDLNSGLSGFWRSRPIDPDRWFWIKYASGLAVLAFVFGGVYGLAWMLDPSESAHNSEHLLQVILAFWTVYASAVCVACLVRNVIYAGILSFAVSAYTTWLALVPYNGEQLPVAMQVLVLVSVGVGLTLLAWQAMRRDWALRLA